MAPDTEGRVSLLYHVKRARRSSSVSTLLRRLEAIPWHVRIAQTHPPTRSRERGLGEAVLATDRITPYVAEDRSPRLKQCIQVAFERQSFVADGQESRGSHLWSRRLNPPECSLVGAKDTPRDLAPRSVVGVTTIGLGDKGISTEAPVTKSERVFPGVGGRISNHTAHRGENPPSWVVDKQAPANEPTPVREASEGERSVLIGNEVVDGGTCTDASFSALFGSRGRGASENL